MRPTKPHTASTPSSTAASITRRMKSCFFLRIARVVVEHVVEVGDVGEADAVRLQGRLHPLAPRSLSKGLRRSSVLATGSSIASAGTSAFVGCSAAESWM